MTANDIEKIDRAVAEFRALLQEQLTRADAIANAPQKRDLALAPCIRIGIAEGDGIGPIIVREARRVLSLLLADEIERGTIALVPIEGLTIEARLAQNAAVPEETLRAIMTCDVLLKGPTTTPKGGTMESANVSLRRALDLYANVRPVSIPELGIDWVFFRENTEGEYVLGSRGVRIDDRLAMDFKVTTDVGTRRIARAAFEYAKSNGKTKLTIVTKANIMKQTDGMFSAIAHEVAAAYPSVVAEDRYVDIMSANLIDPAVRAELQVFLLPNLYGDIITDEAAQLQGGVGTAGSANIGDRYAMFEAIHGSAPRMIEQGLGEYADPTSILRATELLLRHIKRTRAADLLADALAICTKRERRVVVTGRRDGASTRAFADYLLETIDKCKHAEACQKTGVFSLS